jgi:hypothetical protein
MPLLRTARFWFVIALKLAIVALLVWGVRRTLVDAYQQLQRHPLRLQPVWLVASGALYLLGMLPSAMFWHRLLRVLGQKVRLQQAIRAYYIGHLGKYVPGKALVVVLRAGMVRGTEVNTTVAAVTVFIETLTMMASGSFVAAALIALLFGQHWQYAALAVCFMLAAGLPTLPPVFRRIIRLTKIGRANPTALAQQSVEKGDSRLAANQKSRRNRVVARSQSPFSTGCQFEQIDYRTLLVGWLATGLGWFVMGLSLTATLRGMGQESPTWIGGWPLVTMVVAVSVVAGFMSFIPGGLVVRDVVLAELIKPRLGSETAVASALVLRLVWLAAELAISAVLYFWRDGNSPVRHAATPDSIAESKSRGG